MLLAVNHAVNRYLFIGMRCPQQEGSRELPLHRGRYQRERALNLGTFPPPPPLTITHPS